MKIDQIWSNLIFFEFAMEKNIYPIIFFWGEYQEIKLSNSSRIGPWGLDWSFLGGVKDLLWNLSCQKRIGNLK